MKRPEPKMTTSGRPINWSLHRLKVGHYFLHWSKVDYCLHRIVVRNHPTRVLFIDGGSMTPAHHYRRLLTSLSLRRHWIHSNCDTRRPTPSYRKLVPTSIVLRLTISFKMQHPLSNSCCWTDKTTASATSRKYRATISFSMNHILIM